MANNQNNQSNSHTAKDFIYLDEIAINNFLSSLNEPVPEEMIQTRENSGNISAKAQGAGITVGKKTNFEKKLKVFAPYHYQSLRRKLRRRKKGRIFKKEDLAKKNPLQNIKRGDFIEFKSSLSPMAPLLFELVIDNGLKLLNKKDRDLLIDQLEEGNDNSNEIGPFRSDPLQFIHDLESNTFVTRGEKNELSFAVRLERDYMRQEIDTVFWQSLEYTVFGRVEERIIGEAWYPHPSVNILNNLTEDPKLGDQLENKFFSVAETIRAPVTIDDIKIKPRGLIIRPIAIFW